MYMQCVDKLVVFMRRKLEFCNTALKHDALNWPNIHYSIGARVKTKTKIHLVKRIENVLYGQACQPQSHMLQFSIRKF